jgi:hypothetical protein
MRFKKGQRWLWAMDNNSTIVEVMDDDVSFDRNVQCKIVQWISGANYGSVGKISNWNFSGVIKYLTYLEGQDVPT